MSEDLSISMDHSSYKDVVIIGNGPSAISLSYFLSGNWPYYSGKQNPFIPDYLNYKLCQNLTTPIVKQDLYYLSEGLQGRSHNVVSLLMDVLQHPGADVGEEMPSVLHWEPHPSEAINHVVLGQGFPGGAWNKMEGSILTISLGTWMELPNLKIQEWDTQARDLNQLISSFKQRRATVSSVGKYYLDYVNSKNLNDHFINNFTVDLVQKKGKLWNVLGYSELNGKRLCFQTPRVVLATGNSDIPNRLKVKGESYPFVLHSLAELEELLKVKSSFEGYSILIVGAGLSAADAVIAARFHGLSVVHVFRRDVSDPQLIFNKLPANMYPEYHKVYQMMCSSGPIRNSYESYKPYPAHTIEHISIEGQVVIKSNHTQQRSLIKVTHVLVLIGMHPDLSFLIDKKLGIDCDKPINCHTNPIKIDAMTYETTRCPGLYAMGPLIGDNFVRFVQGGALGITAHILQQKAKNTRSSNYDLLCCDEYEA